MKDPLAFFAPRGFRPSAGSARGVNSFSPPRRCPAQRAPAWAADAANPLSDSRATISELPADAPTAAHRSTPGVTILVVASGGSPPSSMFAQALDPPEALDGLGMVARHIGEIGAGHRFRRTAAAGARRTGVILTAETTR
jgi:hypothetical protein